MIVILKGGTSAEREVSLWTAGSIGRALTDLQMTFAEVDAADEDWLDQIVLCRPERVIIALHGPFGEDGTVQELLSAHEIPFTGSGPEASALAIDKRRTKDVVSKSGIHVPQSLTMNKAGKWPGRYPVIVKPNGDGSSFGLTLVQRESELHAALASAEAYGDVIIEEYIQGIEVSCGVIERNGTLEALPVIEIRPQGELFDFAAKYQGKVTEVCPARIPNVIRDAVQAASREVFRVIGCDQYARVDWIIRDGVPYFLEINTLPGMTETSLLPQELAVAGIPYPDFIRMLLSPH